MTPADLTLARRAVACAGWRWLPGMLAVEHATPGNALIRGGFMRISEPDESVGYCLPDLTDPATLGCLLALVREAHGDPLIYAQPAEIEGVLCWLVWHGDRARAAATERPIAMGHTEAAALVAALEAANEHQP